MPDWKKKLHDSLEQHKQSEETKRQKAEAGTGGNNKERKEGEKFILEIVEPAFCTLAKELVERKKQVFSTRGHISRVLHVWSEEIKEFEYSVRIHGSMVRRTYEATSEKNGGPIGKKEPTITNITKDDILDDFVAHYTRTLRGGGLP